VLDRGRGASMSTIRASGALQCLLEALLATDCGLAVSTETIFRGEVVSTMGGRIPYGYPLRGLSWAPHPGKAKHLIGE
jgi:hypothetical protein